MKTDEVKVVSYESELVLLTPKASVNFSLQFYCNDLNYITLAIAWEIFDNHKLKHDQFNNNDFQQVNMDCI